MDFQQVEAFLYVTKEKSFSKAAEKLYITQSTISTRINKLEKDLGVALFDRLGREITLTPFGKVLLPYAEEFVRIIYESQRKIETEKKNLQNKFRIGVSYPFKDVILPYLITELFTHFPEVSIEVMRPESPIEIVKMIELLQVDIGFINDTDLSRVELSERLCSEKIWKNQLLLVANPNHPLRKEEQLQISDILNQQFLCLNPKNAITKAIREYFKAANSESVPMMEINSVDAIKQIVKTTNMLSFLPEYSIREDIQKGELIQLPLVPSLPSQTSLMIYSNQCYMTEMIDFIKKNMNNIVIKVQQH